MFATRHKAFTAVSILATLAAFGCQDPAREFALPPGDAERGRVTFVLLSCNDCHSISGDLERSTLSLEETHFRLGGKTTITRGYPDLVTSIINPSHRVARQKGAAVADADGNSKMRRYNDFMTVQQLVDLTTFLAETYEYEPPEYTTYYF